MSNDLQKQTLDLIKGRGGIAYKIISANERGVPDILACYRGQYLAIEVKNAGDTVKPIQSAQMRRIIHAGGTAIVIRQIESVEKLLGAIDDDRYDVITE